MSVKMLLRTRSSPLLSNLPCVSTVALHHSTTVREVEREKSSLESPRHAVPCLNRSVSFTNAALASAGTSPISQHGGIADDTTSFDGSQWDFSGEVIPWPRFRRAQSEGDLENLGQGSPALIAAAESLVISSSSKGSGEKVFEVEKFSTIQRQWSRRMSLGRQSSLSVIRSNSENSGSESDDIQDEGWVIEVPESVETYLSRAEIAEKESEIPFSFATAIGSRHSCDEGVRSNLQQGSSSNSTEVEVASWEDVDGGAPDGLESEFRMASEATKGHPGKVASVSGRDGTSFYATGDGERYSAVSTGVNGTVLVCTSRGCKPVSQSEFVSPMFIAGGFGIGGGGTGGRNVNVATGGGGGRGDSLGTDAYYKRALESNPGHPLLLRNYAKFLHEVKRDTTKAESFYERAILANPGDGELLGLYANLIWDVYKDEERAGSYFEQALQRCPDNSYVVAAYASFLWALDSVEEKLESPMDLGHCNELGPGVAPRFSSVTAG